MLLRPSSLVHAVALSCVVLSLGCPTVTLAASEAQPAGPPPALGRLSVAQATEPVPGRSVRQIAPTLVAPPDIGSGELNRVDPRAPLSEVGPAGPVRARKADHLSPAARGSADVAAKPAAPTLFRPVASAAGRLEGNGVVVAISGIEIVEPQQMCPRRGGGEWPCGMAARTAFRSLLRNRAVDCGILPDDTRSKLSAACWLGGVNLGAWLVENGWAKVATDGPFAEEQQKAVAAARGIFGLGPEPATPTGGFLPPSQLPAPGPLLEGNGSPILDEGN